MEEAGQTSGFLNLLASAVRSRTNIVLMRKKMHGKLRSILIAGIIAATGILVQDANAFTRSAAEIDGANSDIVKVAVQKQPAAKYRRRVVRLDTDEAPGTIIAPVSAPGGNSTASRSSNGCVGNGEWESAATGRSAPS